MIYGVNYVTTRREPLEHWQGTIPLRDWPRARSYWSSCRRV